MDDEYESVLLVIKECFVYRIPPRTSSGGCKANDWDVNEFLWTGRLRILSKGKGLYINLEDGRTGELFARCHAKDEHSVEAVLDSSRYFVLKLFDEKSKNHAFVGLGFQDRSASFDFNVAIQDFHKSSKNQEKIIDTANVSSSVDLSLKDGQTFSVNIPSLKAKSGTTAKIPVENKFFGIPAPKKRESDNDDDFGDFQGTEWQKF